jgi:pimeloyl-ACP methyl ester carboxylesterase
VHGPACSRVDLAAYTTEASADDVEDLRAALGVEQVVLWGTSYGTHLALSVLRRHPASVDRAILHGVEGPDDTLKLPSQLDANLRELGRYVAADPFWGDRFPDLEAAVREVVADYEARPLNVNAQAPFLLGGWEIQRALAGIAGDSEALADVPMALELLRSRQVEPIAPALAEARRRPALPAMTLSMDCASGASPERRARIAAEAPASALGDAADFPLPFICESWPVPELGDAFRTPVESDVPTLFVSGTLDGRTPVSNAREVMQGFSRGRELVIEGASHDQLFVSDPGIWVAVEDLLAGRPHTVERLVLPPPAFTPLPGAGS